MKFTTLASAFFCLFMTQSGTKAANILGIWFHAGKSHHILGETLLKELARRGHNVTMVSPFPLTEPFPNYTDIHLTGIMEDQIAREAIFMEMNKGGNLVAVDNTIALVRSQTELTLNHTAIRDLLDSGTKFDLIIMDWFMNVALLIFGKLFNCPIIPLASQGITHLSSSITGSPLPPSYVPVAMLGFPPNMTFVQRFINAGVGLIYNIYGSENTRYYNGLLKKYLGTDAPTIDDLRETVALVFTNSHYSFESPRPAVPNMISIGGFHVQRPKALPEDLKRFMDEAADGVIYFSLGSNMKSTLLPADKQGEILQAFSELPHRVLWKWESDNLPGKPDNVLVNKWFSQNDILAHPNVRLFISHGGLLSTIEALHHGVPVLGIPIFGDQQANVKTAVASGYAVHLELEDLNATSFGSALREILNNPIYSRNAKQRSRLLHDQPMAPIDTAVFWVEHVIRHKGAPHLRNGGIYLSWFQYFLLDVVLAVLAVLCVVVLGLRRLWRMVFRHKSNKEVELGPNNKAKNE